jgi:REP element-mobilizing transposase RayT
MQPRPPDEPNPGLDRVRHELRATGIKPEAANPLISGIHSRGFLPHVKREGAAYFITFRLADSLPKEVLLRIEAEMAERLRHCHQARQQGRPTSDSEEEINRDFRRKVERFLDTGHGACHLRRPDVAELVAHAVQHFEGQRYLLSDWVVMPNHVHAVLWPMPNEVLGEILKSWKQFTSRRAKPMVGVTDEHFWQPESFDHWIRDDVEKARICRYIRNNPVTARLCQRPEDWQWSSAWLGWKNTTKTPAAP